MPIGVDPQEHRTQCYKGRSCVRSGNTGLVIDGLPAYRVDTCLETQRCVLPVP